MKLRKTTACLAGLLLLAVSHEAAALAVGEPGFHGVLDVSGFPRPVVTDDDPVIVRPLRVGDLGRPLYVYVPTLQRWRWKQYCDRYGACGRPVYFVKKAWYEKVYLPAWREEQRRREISRHHRSGHARGVEF